MLLTSLRLPLKLLPDVLHTQVATAIANHLLRGQRLAARLSELEGYSVCLAILDTGSRLHVRVRNGRLVPAGAGSPDVTIRGNLQDFAALATRTEDPDTLFFQRRLCIEGDTETGLHVKNILDALHYDWEAHVREVLPAPLAGAGVDVARRLHALIQVISTGAQAYKPLAGAIRRRGRQAAASSRLRR